MYIQSDLSTWKDDEVSYAAEYRHIGDPLLTEFFAYRL